MRRRLTWLLVAFGFIASACAGSTSASANESVEAPSTVVSTTSTAAPESTTTEPADDEDDDGSDSDVIVVTATTDPDATTTTTTEPVESASEADDDVDPATAVDPVGQQIDLSGDSDLILWFWAPW